MTTTLRPAEPERRGPDDVRSRRYQVCVNSRPVGAVLLSTDWRLGPAVGRIEWLGIDEPDRRRGRGTVAALAAEEVLRTWGCRQAVVSIPAEGAVALRLATALGYVESDRGMVKTMPADPPDLPDGSVVRPMTAQEYQVWHECERRACVQERVDRGMPYDRAVTAAAADPRATVPDGNATVGDVLLTLSHAGADVGHLRLRLPLGDPATPDADAEVFCVEVEEAHRGRGHGRTLMLAAERECHAAGVRAMGLNVSSANPRAARLYESLGYRVTDHHLAKPLL